MHFISLEILDHFSNRYHPLSPSDAPMICTLGISNSSAEKVYLSDNHMRNASHRITSLVAHSGLVEFDQVEINSPGGGGYDSKEDSSKMRRIKLQNDSNLDTAYSSTEY